MKLFALVPVLLASSLSHAASAAPAPNVILITLDGVRWEEVFRGVDPGQSVDPNPQIFPFLTGTLAKQGVLFGNHGRGETVRVGNSHQNSLPGYQSIMACTTQPCGSNLCGRIPVETFPERLLHDLNLKPEQVATIASWDKIANAVEHVEGTLFVNAGNRALKIDGDPINDADAALNAAQAKDVPPWKDARWDKYTVGHALEYLKAKRPRFLFVSLNDSDEWGHKGQYDQYVATLRQQDNWIRDIVTTLDGMGEYGRNTTLIITTDHGRGEGNDWDDHGVGYPDSGNVWIYARSPYTEKAPAAQLRTPASAVVYSHLDIRPTIETVFGLEPKLDGVSPLPGHAISAVVGKPSPEVAGTVREAKAPRIGRSASRSTATAKRTRSAD